MKVKKIKIHGGGTKRIKIRNKVTPGKVVKTGATAYSNYKKYQKFNEEAKEQGKKIHRYEYDPWNAPMVNPGIYVAGPDTDRKIREFDEWRKKQPQPKMTKEDLDYLEQNHLILTERSERIAKEKEEQRKLKRQKAISACKEVLGSIVGYSGGVGRIITTTRKLAKGKTEFAKFKISNKSSTSRSPRHKKYKRRHSR